MRTCARICLWLRTMRTMMRQASGRAKLVTNTALLVSVQQQYVRLRSWSNLCYVRDQHRLQLVLSEPPMGDLKIPQQKKVKPKDVRGVLPGDCSKRDCDTSTTTALKRASSRSTALSRIVRNSAFLPQSYYLFWNACSTSLNLDIYERLLIGGRHAGMIMRISSV